MASIKFRLSGRGFKKNIYVRLLDGRDIDIRASIGQQIEAEYWSDNQNKKIGGPLPKVASSDKLNISKDLKKLYKKIDNELDGAHAEDIPINSSWLRKIIDEHRGKSVGKVSDYLLDNIIFYKESLEEKNKPIVEQNKLHALKSKPQIKLPVALGTIRNFTTTWKRLKKFEKLRKKYRVKDVDLTFHKAYEKFALRTLDLSINSIAKDIKQIKTVCLDAKDRGIKINYQVMSKKFKATYARASFVTLDESEIELIKSYHGKDYLENAKDWLIIGCWTGCRISDLMNLTLNNIHTNVEGLKFIRYTQSKTGKTVDVLIHNDVLSILDKRGNFPRKISDQKFNDYIKLVCKEVKLNQEIIGAKFDKISKRKKPGTFQKWELVTSHICRRSFATNHYNKLPNKLIMAVTGHATETMLLSYIGEIDNSHLETFEALWKTIDKKIVPIISKSNQ